MLRMLTLGSGIIILSDGVKHGDNFVGAASSYFIGAGLLFIFIHLNDNHKNK